MSLHTFTTKSLSAITNLAKDFAVEMDGQQLQYPLGSIGKTSGTDRSVIVGGHNPNVWAFSVWFIPNWANTDGLRHFIAQIRLDSSNHVDIEKTAAGAILVTVVSAGVSRSATLTLPFSSGATVFLGASLDGLGGALTNTGTFLTLFADTDSDNILETNVGATDVPLAVFPGAYKLHVGSDFEGSYPFDGALQFCLLNEGANDSIQERFNSGAGRALEGEDSWLARWVDHLVICVSGDATNLRADSRFGAVNLLDITDPISGGYEFIRANQDRIVFGDQTMFNGVTKATWMFDFERKDNVANWTLAGRLPNTPNTDRQWGAGILNLGELSFQIGLVTNPAGENGAGRTTIRYAAVDQRLVWVVRFDGTDTGDAARLRFWFAYYNEETRQWGPMVEIPDADITNVGTDPVPALMNSVTTSDLVFGALGDLGLNFASGKMYEHRFSAGQALDPEEIESLVPGEIIKGQWTHVWTFDGDAVEKLGTGVDGTLSATTGDGPDEVTDRRGFHHGDFESVIENGVYGFDGVDDKILTSDPGAGADGLSTATWGLWIRPLTIDAGLATIFGRWDGADNQFRIARNGADIRVYISSGGASAADFTDFTIGMKRGERWKFIVVYEGGVGNEVTLYSYLFDEVIGQWGSRSAPAPSITGTIPNTLASSALGYVFGDGEYFGEIDEVRVWNAVALTTVESDTETIYRTIKAGLNHRWKMDGNADDSAKGLLDGIVTGAVQDADRRQPVGFVREGIGEIERARGSFLRLPGVSGDYASIPSSSALDISNDRLEVWFDVALDDWAPPVNPDTLISRWETAGNQRSYRIYVNTTGGGSLIEIFHSQDGTTFSSFVVPTRLDSFINDTQRLKIRVQIDALGPDSTVRVWTRGSDLDPWISIFNSNNLGDTAIFNSTAPLEFGSAVGGTENLLLGRYYSCRLWDGFREEGAAEIANVDFTTLTSGQTSFKEKAQGLDVSLNGNAVVEGSGGVSVGDFRYRIKALNDHHELTLRQDPSVTPFSGRLNVIRAITRGLPDSSGTVKIKPSWQADLETEILRAASFEQYASARRNSVGVSGVNQFGALTFSEAYIDELRSLVLDRVSPVKERIIHV